MLWTIFIVVIVITVAAMFCATEGERQHAAAQRLAENFQLECGCRRECS